MSDGPYEPWRPTVGQRVWTLVSSECEAGHLESSQKSGSITGISWSSDLGPEPYPEYDPDDPDPTPDLTQGYRGHWYEVTFDEPVQQRGYTYPIKRDLFAAVELHPLESQHE